MMRKDRSGSAILSVTLLGLLILAMSGAMIAVTTTFNKQSFVANKQIVTRYAAEGVLERIRYRIALEDSADAGGWFDNARRAPDPVESLTVPLDTPSALDTSATPDRTQVEVRIYDSTEAPAVLGETLAADEYIVEARATSGSNTSVLQMKVKYSLTETTTTTETPNPASLFSKYGFWTNVNGTQAPGNQSGYIHRNGNHTVGTATDRFALPVTCTGTLTYKANPPQLHFDWNGNGFLDSTPRPEFGGLSELDVWNLSGGNKPRVDQPAYQGIDTQLRAAAVSQTTNNSSLVGLFVDPANSTYSAAFGNPNYSSFETKVSMRHQANANTIVTVELTALSGGNRVTVQTQNVQIPPNTPLILYSTPRISSLGGTIYGQMTITTPFIGVEDPTKTLGGTPVLWPPSIEITDHLIQVDSQGRPKYWMYQNNSMMNQPGSLGLTGPVVNNSNNVNTSNVDWSPANGYEYKRNPAFDPNARTSLGVMGNGDVVMANPGRNFIWNAALYGADPRSRVSIKWGMADNHRNQVRAGSRVTSRFGQLGPPFDYTIRHYDPDLLTTPPPFWIAPAGVTVTTTTTTTVTAVCGAVYERARRF